MPVANSTLDCAFLKERLAALSATVATLQRQHLQRQFDECWAASGGAEGLADDANSAMFYANPSAGQRSSRPRTDRHQTNRPNHRSSSRHLSQSSATGSSSSASSSTVTTAGIPRRRASVIHNLHLVGVCAEHETDESSCDEALATERAQTRQMIAKLKADEAREATTNKEAANSVTSVGNAAIAAGLTITSGQMNHLAKVVARRSINVSEKYNHRRTELEARSKRRIQSLLERKRAKRQIETGLYKALHTPPVLQKRVPSAITAKTSAVAAASAGFGFSSSALPDASTFKIADLAAIKAEERIAANSTPLHKQLMVSMDRYLNRMRRLKSLRAQDDFAHMNAAEKASAELALVMKKRREFHRVRGAAGGMGADFGDEDE